MICDFLQWWALLTHDGFKFHVNFTEGLNLSTDESIKVGKEEAGTSDFNHAYDKFWANQDKAKTSQLLEME